MMKRVEQFRLFVLILVTTVLVVSASGLAISDPSALNIKPLSAKVGEDVVGEFGMTFEMGVMVEFEVTASAETKV